MRPYLNQRVPVSDGVELATDVWLPDGPVFRDASLPTVLYRTPYHRTGQTALAQRFTDRGYAYVAQDVRGKYDSTGTFRPIEQEAADGRDTLDWIANQQWCNRRIGIYGRSYPGMVQLPAAGSGHEALRCIIPAVAPGNYFSDWVRYDGCFALANMIRWPFCHATATTQPSFTHFTWQEIWDLSKSASIDEIERYLGAPLETTRKWLEHDTDDEYWESLNLSQYFPLVCCAGLHVGGYFDHLSRGQIQAFEGISAQGATETARNNQRLILGPWGHSSTEATQYGVWDFGAEAGFDYVELSMRFFDLWLRDIDDGISTEAPVRYFHIGENRWVDADSWPPESAIEKQLYLGNNSTLCDSAASGTDCDSFVYDPADPVPTLGGQVYWGLADTAPLGPADQRPILDRSDVVCFRSETLGEPLSVAGPIGLELWISSTAEDTDFIAKLCVVEGDGRTVVVTLGSLQCRFRESSTNPSPIPKGEALRLEIQMNHIAYTFGAGCRIALIITSSCFPRILPHTNRYEQSCIGVPGVPATQTIHHGGEYPSCLKLPVVPVPMAQRL